MSENGISIHIKMWYRSQISVLVKLSTFALIGIGKKLTYNLSCIAPSSNELLAFNAEQTDCLANIFRNCFTKSFIN